jgi:hypothetical protein
MSNPAYVVPLGSGTFVFACCWWILSVTVFGILIRNIIARVRVEGVVAMYGGGRRAESIVNLACAGLLVSALFTQWPLRLRVAASLAALGDCASALLAAERHVEPASGQARIKYVPMHRWIGYYYVSMVTVLVEQDSAVFYIGGVSFDRTGLRLERTSQEGAAPGTWKWERVYAGK